MSNLVCSIDVRQPISLKTLWMSSHQQHDQDRAEQKRPGPEDSLPNREPTDQRRKQDEREKHAEHHPAERVRQLVPPHPAAAENPAAEKPAQNETEDNSRGDKEQARSGFFGESSSVDQLRKENR
ncbi:MAG: hypothetical protein ACREQK_18075 [Candidatus Binatia bacterium]